MGTRSCPVQEMQSQLLDPIIRAAERRGKIIIPGSPSPDAGDRVVLHNLSVEGRSLSAGLRHTFVSECHRGFPEHPECYDEERSQSPHNT